jgi:hypothetical protein
MGDDELMDNVRGLRSRGCTPRQIAHALGVRPAKVAPLVRAIAKEQAATAPQPAVAGCWVSPGWSVGLTVDQQYGWPDRPGSGTEASGLAGVVVAREGRSQRADVSVCGYLVDTYCLGVKDAMGPWSMDPIKLRRFLNRFFTAFDDEPLEAPIELARHLVWGAVAYARRLGFEPHPDFAMAADHLSPLSGANAIGFGRFGKPFYVQGPYDDVDRIVRTLGKRVGMDDAHFLVEAPLPRM